MPRVFVINEPSLGRGKLYDIEPARLHGELVFVFPTTHATPSQDPQSAVVRAHEVLADYTAEDLIVWAGGDPLAFLITAGVLGDKAEGPIKYLRWERSPDRGDGYYRIMPVDLWPDETNNGEQP